MIQLFDGWFLFQKYCPNWDHLKFSSDGNLLIDYFIFCQSDERSKEIKIWRHIRRIRFTRWSWSAAAGSARHVVWYSDLNYWGKSDWSSLYQRRFLITQQSFVEDQVDDSGGGLLQECSARSTVWSYEGLGAKYRTFFPQVFNYSRRQRLCPYTATYQWYYSFANSLF